MQYRAALFQYGRLSAFSAMFCTKSIKIQQQGASIAITRKPTHICNMPDIRPVTFAPNILRQLYKPKRIATKKRNKEREEEK